MKGIIIAAAIAALVLSSCAADTSTVEVSYPASATEAAAESAPTETASERETTPPESSQTTYSEAITAEESSGSESSSEATTAETVLPVVEVAVTETAPTEATPPKTTPPETTATAVTTETEPMVTAGTTAATVVAITELAASESAMENELSAPAAQSAALVRGTYAADDVSVKTSGRTFYRDGVRWINYSCSSVEFCFTGTKAEITMVSDAWRFGYSRKARVAFFVNGEMVRDEMLYNNEETFTVFESDTPQEVTITVMKLSEVQFGRAGVKYITVTSENKIAPTADKERSIEFIGDSITCAYGIEGTAASDFSTRTENAYNGYAAQTARNLGADFDIVAWSGIGVVSDCTTYGIKSAYALMPDIYRYTDYCYEHSIGTAKTEWDFALSSPDVIVINLGTNDYTYTGKNAALQDEFGAGYYNFLSEVRAYNPDSVIICAYGVIENQLMPEIREQVENFKANTGDTKVYALEFELQKHSDGYGVDYHPSLATHNKMTVTLTNFIRDIMGW